MTKQCITIETSDEIFLSDLIRFLAEYPHVEEGSTLLIINDDLLWEYDWQDENCRPGPMRIFDADGKEYEDVLKCNTKTGRILQLKFENKNCNTVLVKAPAPLRTERRL